MARALVLAGGGVAGIAWELGVLTGLVEADPALASWLEADVVVGTSAGSSVGAQVTSGTSLADLYAAQLAPRSPEIPVDLDLEAFVARLQEATAGATSAADVRHRIAAFALAADTVPEADRRAVMAARLPRHTWPRQDLRVVAVDAETGDRVVFTSASGVDLVDAVAASCAVPGVWPPMTVGGRRYVDGGVWSGANADLAAGADEVLVLTPTLPDAPTTLGRPLADELAELGEALVHVVHADEASVAAFGTNPLAAGTREPSARAGLAVGRAAAARLGSASGRAEGLRD